MIILTGRKIAAGLLRALLLLVLLEAGLRLGGFVLFAVREYGNLQSIKQKGAYRILCLGESTTREQYPSFLEEILNQRSAGVRFNVIDKGNDAANTLLILSRVESYLAEYRPDMVIAMMGNNDRGLRYFHDIPEADTWIFRHCRIYRLGRIFFMYISQKINRENIDGFSKGDWGGKAKTENAATASAETFVGKPTKYHFKSNQENAGPRSPYLNGSKLPEAKKFSGKNLKLNFRNNNAYVESGRLYLDQGKFPQAEDYYRKAIELNPENDDAYVELGWLYRRQEKFSQAEAFFKKAIAIDPENVNAYDRLGWFYRDQGEFAQAEDSFRKAIEIHPGNDNAYFALGVLYRDQGKLSQAENCFRKAVEINPKSDRTLGALASLYEEMGKPELAQDYAEKADRLRSQHYPAVTVNNYRKLKGILDRKGIKLVCVQYPMRNVELLKKIFEHDKGVIFVDNESLFKTAVKKSGYKEYFRDAFAGDFGHCTQKGNELLAQNIANVILREVFNK